MSAAASTTQVTGPSLATLEFVIEHGLKTFVDVGSALALIRDLRRYKDGGYADFDSYCRERWGFGRDRAYQMIRAATIAEELPTIVGIPAPSNEAQARALADVPSEHRTETWAAAVKERGDDVTARDVRDVAQVLEAARAEPDGARLIAEVASGNWDIPEVKKELTHRGVEWNPARAEQRRIAAEDARASDALIEALADSDDLDRGRLRLEFWKDMKHLMYLIQLKPDALAAALKPNELPGVRVHIVNTRAWLDAVERAIEPRAGLRVVS